MSYDSSRPSTYAAGGVIDAGLQAFMQGVYRVMGAGLVVTGLTAIVVASTPAIYSMIFGTPLAWVVMLAPLGFVFFGFTPARVARMSPSSLRMTFYVFSAVMGLSMATIFMVFTGASIARVFFITAAAFLATSLYGYTTKRDLTAMGSFLFMGLIGIVIASLVNLFVQSSMVQFTVSILGVLIFTGLTAWETQRLKSLYAAGAGDANDKVAVMGALSLYLNFINLFQSLLHFFGERR